MQLLQEEGQQPTRPQSGHWLDGFFELRSKEARIFYVFLANLVAVLLGGEIKKRNDVPLKTRERVRGYQREVVRRKCGSRQEKKR